MKPPLHLLPLAVLTVSCAPKPPPPSSPRNIVLVHGFLDSGKTFRPMQHKLEERGHRCIAPRLLHIDGRGGLPKIAGALKQDIDAAFGPHEPISIVAFSMGGMVSRHYLQHLDGASRCDHLFTISSPHHGTTAGFLYPSQGARDMRPGSDFLRSLASTESSLGDMEIVSYWSPMDLVILPPQSSEWPRAENIRVLSPLHPMMLSSRTVIHDIVRRLQDH